MAREILFKAKRKDNGEWVEGNLIQTTYFEEVRSWISTPEDKTRLRTITSYYGDWRAVEVRTDTICQYTGLTDKSGNKIWENDVIKAEDYYVNMGIIKFGTQNIDIPEYYTVQYDGFYIEWKKQINCCFRKDLRFWAKRTSTSVIGNIFDNPELLEVLS